LDIPSNYAAVFQLRPSFGTLQGNQSITLSCSFAPRRKRFYKVRIPCKVSSVMQSNNGKLLLYYSNKVALLKPIKKEYILTAIGEGTGGVLSLEPAVTTFECTLIGSTEKRQILLHNTSNCYVNYVVGFEPNEKEVPQTPRSIVEGKYL
jgi:hypothetical protein